MNSKVFTLMVVSGLLVVLGVAPVGAQTNVRLTANIPFEFMAGDKRLPAGEYTVNPQIEPGVLRIQNDESRDSAFAITNAVETLNYSDQAKLIFHRYGNLYFLSQVWTLGGNVGRELPKSKVEREASQTASVKRDNVIILAMR